MALIMRLVRAVGVRALGLLARLPMPCSAAWALILRFGQQHRNSGCRNKKKTGIEQRFAVVAYVRKQPEHYGSKRCGNSSDVVTKSSAGGPQQRGKQWGQIHCKQRKSSLAKPNQQKPPQQRCVVTGHVVRAEYGEEIAQEN